MTRFCYHLWQNLDILPRRAEAQVVEIRTGLLGRVSSGRGMPAKPRIEDERTFSRFVVIRYFVVGRLVQFFEAVPQADHIGPHS